MAAERIGRPPRHAARGQIAIFFLMLTVISVLLAVFLINIGQVGFNKSATAIAADTSALGVASTLGIYSRTLALELGDGKKYKSKKCELDILTILLFVVLIILIIIVIIVSIICWGSCTAALVEGLIGFWGAVTALGAGYTVAIVPALIVGGILGAIGSAVQIGIKNGILEPQQARAFNKERAKFANAKDPIREDAILGAFLRVVDDPSQTTDTTDIDEDGDTAEEVSPFSQWYDARLKDLVLQSVAQKPAALAEINALKTKLAALKPELEALKAAIDSPIIPLFEWIESLGPTFNISFWMPGDQSSSPLEPDDTAPCEVDNTLPCGPPPTSLPDEVDWLKVQLSTFIVFAEFIVSMPDEVILASAFQIEELIKEFWLDELKTWAGMIKDWINELKSMKSRIPWPPDFTIGGVDPQCNKTNCQVVWPPSPPTLTCADSGGVPILGCSITSSNPPVLPSSAVQALIPAGKHPIDVITEILTKTRDAILAFNPSFAKFTPKPVSMDAPVFSWKDNRGWHHAQVDVTGFEIPRMKAKPGLFLQCILVKHHSQEISVKVTRYDQDNEVLSGLYTLRYRPNAKTTTFDDGGDAAHQNDALIRTKFLPKGMTSEGRAAHGYKPNSVGIIKGK